MPRLRADVGGNSKRDGVFSNRIDGYAGDTVFERRHNFQPDRCHQGYLTLSLERASSAAFAWPATNWCTGELRVLSFP